MPKMKLTLSWSFLCRRNNSCLQLLGSMLLFELLFPSQSFQFPFTGGASSTLVFHFKTKGITRNLLLKRQLLALSTSGLTHERKYFWEVAPEEEIPITGLSIFTASSEAFDLRRPHEGVTCEVVDGIKDVFYLHGVLSQTECEKMLTLSETMGYIDFNSGKNTNGALCWIGDQTSVMDPLFERIEPFLPPELRMKNGERHKPVGLNARMRFYRYKANGQEEFRAHKDDSFPGSGLSEDKKTLIWDAFGDRKSVFTFLLYLNDDFGGGHTTFYPEGLQQDLEGNKQLPRIKVKPRQGSVLCFYQSYLFGQDGDLAQENLDAPLHEGSSVFCNENNKKCGARPYGGTVECRPKYVVRSDVLYQQQKQW